MLTAVLCHGHGLWMFLTAQEGMSAGSNWNWECVSWLVLLFCGVLERLFFAFHLGDASPRRCLDQDPGKKQTLSQRVTWLQPMHSFKATISNVRLWVQSDNTVKERRNQFASKMQAAMTQAGLWEVASNHYLQVGHTHEDVDSIFALAAVALRNKQLETPMDIARVLDSKLSKLWTSKSMTFSIEVVDTVSRINFTMFYGWVRGCMAPYSSCLPSLNLGA